MNKRQQMNKSHAIAREFLLKMGAEHVWIKPHYQYPTTVYCSNYNYKTQDVWNLFDGFCSYKKVIYGLQISTNSYHKEEPFREFRHKFALNLGFMLIKVTTKGEVTIKTVRMRN